MPHSLRRTSVCVLCLAASLAGGCVTDPADNARKAWWVSRNNPDRGWLGLQRQKTPPPKLALSYAQYAADSGNFDKARQSYEMVLKDDPRSVDAIIGLARLDQLGGRTEHAEKGFQKALKLRPGDPAALDALGQFYAAQKRWPDAIQHLNAAVLGEPNEKTYRYHFAVALASAGDAPRALQQFAMTVGEAEAHYNVGHILYERGDLAEAERQFLAAVLKQPNLEVAQQMLEEIRGAQGEHQILPASASAPPQRERRVQLSGAPPVEPPVNAAFHELPHAPNERATRPAPNAPLPQRQASNVEIPFGEPPAPVESPAPIQPAPIQPSPQTHMPPPASSPPATSPPAYHESIPRGYEASPADSLEPPQWNGGDARRSPATRSRASRTAAGAPEPPAWPGRSAAPSDEPSPFSQRPAVAPRATEPQPYHR